MPGELSPIDKAKFVAAKRAAQFVEDGMRVGLGTGSTAAWLVRCLGEMVRVRIYVHLERSAHCRTCPRCRDRSDQP